MKNPFVSKITRGKLKDFIVQYATEEKTLDLGSAGGPYARFFPNRISADIAEGPGVDVVADAHDLPFEDNEFSCIICTEVLEHLHTPEQAISEMYRVLKPGGRLVLTTRFMFPIHDAPGDYFRYTRFGLKHLFSQWENFEITDETNGFEAIAAIMQRIGYQSTFRVRYITKPLVYILSYVIKYANACVVENYGDITKRGDPVEYATFTTGYYITCTKKSS